MDLVTKTVPENKQLAKSLSTIVGLTFLSSRSLEDFQLSVIVPVWLFSSLSAPIIGASRNSCCAKKRASAVSGRGPFLGARLIRS